LNIDDYHGPDRRQGTGEWEVALARVEGKLDAIITSTAMLTSTVTDLDRRVRDVETSMATVKQKLNTIERHEAPRTNWTSIVAALVAALGVLLIILERLYTQ
jgi:hypothetical protein